MPPGSGLTAGEGLPPYHLREQLTCALIAH